MAHVTLTEQSILYGQEMEVHLSHDEVERICSAAEPIKVLLSIVPEVGKYLAALASVTLWALRSADKKSGNNGCRLTVRINPGLLNPLPGMIWVKPPTD